MLTTFLGGLSVVVVVGAITILMVVCIDMTSGTELSGQGRLEWEFAVGHGGDRRTTTVGAIATVRASVYFLSLSVSCLLSRRYRLPFSLHAKN
jgi:NADH:ubiquinone oxidoreductase subunit 6 (subunit J)